MIRQATFALLAAATLVSPALAQGSAEHATGITQQDQEFLNYAAQDNQGEIRLGILAEKKAVNPAVKAFARLMVVDHIEMINQMALVTNSEAVTVPEGIGQEDTQTMTRLLSLNGGAFDQAFIKAQVEDHSRDVQRFGQEERSTQNAAIKRFAEVSAPILQQHLQLAEAVQAQLQGQGSHS